MKINKINQKFSVPSGKIMLNMYKVALFCVIARIQVVCIVTCPVIVSSVLFNMFLITRQWSYWKKPIITIHKMNKQRKSMYTKLFKKMSQYLHNKLLWSRSPCYLSLLHNRCLAICVVCQDLPDIL